MANEFVVKNGLISQGSSVITGTLEVSSHITGSNLVLQGNQISGSSGGNITLRTGGDVTVAGGLNIATGPLQFGGSGGSVGQVLTSAGTSTPPTWSPPTSITALTGDVVATGPGSVTSTVQGMGGASSTVHYVIEGGKYATLQAAVDAATADDVILVGPKTTGNWGNTTLYGNKNLLIGALGGSHANKVVEVGSITYAVDTSGSLNVNENEVFINGLYIQGSFADACVILSGSSRPGRLRLMGCYINNTNTSGVAAVKNVNTPTFSSIYVDNCVVSISNDTSGVAVYHSGTYTTIRNRTDATGGQYALTALTGTVEIFESLLSVNKSNAAIDVSGPGTYVAVGYSTIQNTNTANSSLASGVAVGAGSIFGIGDATISVGSVAPPGISSGSVATGLGTFLYGALTFSYVTTIATAVASPAYQAGGVFTQGIGVGLLSQFSVSPTGNVTGSNMRLTGDIAVNGGDITTTATTFNLVNATATTVNLAGAATTLGVGNTATAAQTVNLGTASTGASTYNLGTGATTTGTTKTVNLGTGGAASSTTNVNIGSSNGGTTTIASPTIVGSSTTQTLFNTTATTVNFAGAASTALNIGNSAGTNTILGASKFNQGMSGSLTKLVNGTNYLLAGGGITLSTGSNGAVTIANTIGDVQIFTSSGTWTKPTSFTPKFARIVCIGAGGGGGGGAGDVDGQVRCGGSGGGGGAFVEKVLDISELSATETVTVGTGGSAGTGGIGGPGNNGGIGGNSIFGTNLVTAYGGGGGAGGANSTTPGGGGGGGGSGAAGGVGSTIAGAGGFPGVSTPSGSIGGQGSAGPAGANITTHNAEYGGGGGGGHDAAAASSGGGGSIWGGSGGGCGGGMSGIGSSAGLLIGNGGVTGTYVANTGAAGGASGGSPTAGTAGSATTSSKSGAGGGGGGANTNAAGGTGGAGGAGGVGGGAGGGGGAGRRVGGTGVGGAGGAGGRGEVRVYTW